jgi:hypothetical protein
MNKDTGQQLLEKLISQIQEAFADAEYPGDDNLVTSSEYLANLQIEIDFGGKHWKDVTTNLILSHRLDLHRFTPEAFCFYLPAFLVASLGGEHSGEIISHVFWSFDPQQCQGKASNEFSSRVKVLSSKQKAVVKAFVQYYRATEAIQLPVDKRVVEFWANYVI